MADFPAAPSLNVPTIRFAEHLDVEFVAGLHTLFAARGPLRRRAGRPRRISGLLFRPVGRPAWRPGRPWPRRDPPLSWPAPPRFFLPLAFFFQGGRPLLRRRPLRAVLGSLWRARPAAPVAERPRAPFRRMEPSSKKPPAARRKSSLAHPASPAPSRRPRANETPPRFQVLVKCAPCRSLARRAEKETPEFARSVVPAGAPGPPPVFVGRRRLVFRGAIHVAVAAHVGIGRAHGKVLARPPVRAHRKPPVAVGAAVVGLAAGAVRATPRSRLPEGGGEDAAQRSLNTAARRPGRRSGRSCRCRTRRRRAGRRHYRSAVKVVNRRACFRRRARRSMEKSARRSSS